MKRNGFILTLVMALTIIGVGSSIPTRLAGIDLRESDYLTTEPEAVSPRPVSERPVLIPLNKNNDEQSRQDENRDNSQPPERASREGEVILDLVSYPAE